MLTIILLFILIISLLSLFIYTFAKSFYTSKKINDDEHDSINTDEDDDDFKRDNSGIDDFGDIDVYDDTDISNIMEDN